MVFLAIFMQYWPDPHSKKHIFRQKLRHFNWRKNHNKSHIFVIFLKNLISNRNRNVV